MKFRLYVGWDERDWLAFQVCRQSFLRHVTLSPGDFEIVPLIEWDLRRAGYYTRETLLKANGQKFDVQDQRPHSTGFSYTRYLTAWLEYQRPEEERAEWFMFCDADMMFNLDITYLLDSMPENPSPLYVVKHNQPRAEEGTQKIGGLVQQNYAHGRKNWASVMLFYGKAIAATVLLPTAVSSWSRTELDSFSWMADDDIGELDQKWNSLHGVMGCDAGDAAAITHFTLGTPDVLDDDGSRQFELWNAHSEHFNIDRSLW
jgi:hypothetical protein